jgi:septum formation topological specificity factor MinE
MEQMRKEADDRFYAELIKYLRGEPSGINPRTVEELQALIAKKLTDADPELLLPEMREKLMAAVQRIYESDHAVKVTLTKEDLAFAQMVATHEDDMGRA